MRSFQVTIAPTDDPIAATVYLISAQRMEDAQLEALRRARLDFHPISSFRVVATHDITENEVISHTPAPHPSLAVLEELGKVLRDKAHDYAASDWDDNFTGTAFLTGLDPEQVFHVLVGIKIERLRSLLAGGKKPKNESLDDTLIDLANYAILWITYRKKEHA